MNMTTDHAKIILPAALAYEDVAALAEDLKQCRGRPTDIDLSEAGHLPTRAAQLLLLAARVWATDAVDFRLTNSGEASRASLRNIGLHEAVLAGKVTQ